MQVFPNPLQGLNVSLEPVDRWEAADLSGGLSPTPSRQTPDAVRVIKFPL